MATEKRLIEIPSDGIVRIPIMSGADTVGEKAIDLSHIPTVDAVEVVRCKDCIHWYDKEGVCLKIYSDGAVSPYAWQDRNPDDFCSYGERGDNNG